MLSTIQESTTKTITSRSQRSNSTPQPKSQLVATWTMKNNRLVCKWLTH